MYPGRWNLPGQEAIYTSADVATPVLERLVHTSKASIPINLALMKITLKLDKKPHLTTATEYLLSTALPILTTLAKAKTALANRPPGNAALLGIAVPSVILPAWNIVLYPEHPLFWSKVSLRSIEPFHFDPRLFPEEAHTIV